MIEVKNLTKSFGDNKVLDDISMSFEAGKCNMVIGASGSGKTVLLKNIMGLLTPDSGEILYSGKDLAKMPPKERKLLYREMGVLFQSNALFDFATVEENIGFPMEFFTKLSKAEKKEKTDMLLERVGLPGVNGKYPSELSGGMQKRVGIARALALNPEFIVCDEPVSALDVSIQAQVLNLLCSLQEKFGISYMFITHDLSVVNYISDEIMVMYLGRVVEKAPASELFHNPLHPYTKALLSAIPVPQIRNRPERIILEGEVTSPVDPPKACRFAGRCRYATEKCRKAEPALSSGPDGHGVACFLYNSKEITDVSP